MKFYGEILIFTLLFLTNFRVFFVNHVRRDPLVCLASFTFFISILQIFNWGAEIFNLTGLLLSILVLLSNFHAMFRYSERLYVDHYSSLMKVWATITCLLSAAALCITVFFAPSEIKDIDQDVHETQIRLKGSFKSGFEPASPFSISTATITEYSMFPNLNYRQDVILFVPDKRADTLYYKPYLQLLAKQGHTVCSADFYSKDCRWLHTFEDSKFFRRFSMVIRSVANNQWFMAQREYYTYNISLELEALFNQVQARYGDQCRFFLISDVMGNTACEDFAKKYPQKITGYFSIDSIPEYKTPGYGFIEQTDPLLALTLNVPKDKNPSDMLIPRFAANLSIEKANEAMGIKSK